MKLKELKSKKYIALIMMIVIIGAIVGILKIGNMDFDKGKVKVSKAVINNVTSSLSANVNEAIVDNLITSKGYDEIDYVIKYSLSTDENIKERDVIIEASLDDNEKYASFKDITNGDVTSTVSENRKNIKVTVKNAKVNKENELKLVMKLEGAPNGYKVTPKIKIKEVSEEKYTNLNVQNVEVKNNSLTGNVQDEQSMNVSNIELALKKDGETIKKTYTDENGNYVFSDIEEGEYNLEIDEDIYEKVSEEKVNISGSSKLNIVVKEVTPYKIELKKQITEMTIVNGGKTTTYKYGNLDKVQQALKNVKNMTGEVKYKITIQNTGKKSGVVTVVKDEMPEGLTFNKEKNTSWEEKNGILYNRSLEGITLNAGEKREEGLTLDIESTSEAKTYINKVTAKGEIYENIVYILDGKTYKEDTVLEGEKIKEPKVDNKNFKGWYTDKKYTNKYNFNNEVKKDLVLYGQTEDIKEYTVTYVDNEKIVKTEKVKENGSLNAPEVSKEGYTFKCWSEEPNGKEYDLSTKVTKDITLYSVYDINKYTVTFINENEKYDEQQIEYGGNIKAPTSPSKTYYTFKYWSLEENGDSYDLNTKVTKDITLYSVYDINKYTVTFIDKGKEIDKQELEAGSIVIAPKVSMEGYTFKYWSEKENGEEYNLNLPITKNLTLYSVYEINKYNVEFYDNDKLIKIIKVDYDNTINSNEVPTVSKTGYTFTGWTENDKNFDFTTKIKENKKLYSKYEIIKNAVIFNDENRITTKNVDYNNKVEKIESQGKTGYTFKYWSLTQDGEEFDFNTLITESITLYAVYNINEYNVNFIDQGNAYGDTQKVKYNNAAVKPETDPTKEGYTFKYWSLEENGAAYDFNTKITKNTTLYSVYSINNYKVSFIDNGTKYIEDENIEYNGIAVKPETDPSKEGYTFRYWSLEENGTVYDFNTKITKDITLYSVYSVNSYKVSFIDNGTKYIEDETIEYNGVAVKPETDPSKVGHTFKYWSLKENGTAYNFNTKITKDTILYSVYDANEYTVKFMNGDNLFKQEQVKYGLKVTKPSENPTKEHNIFKTWTLNDNEYDFDLPVTDNIVLHSTYEEIEKPSISHVPTEWTNNKVTVTITSSHEDYKYLYKIDTGEYKEYTGPFDIDYNCTVVAKSVKENVDSITESHDITNIDKIKPTINSLSSGNITDDGFDININSIDNESGMKRVYIYKDDVLETSIVYNEQFNEEKNSSYTFSGLSNGETYKIKVVAEDVAGNLSESKEIDVEIKNIIVARIIGRKGNLYNNESLYENFNSLEKAIKSCGSNQCTIQMVLDTNESVEVLDGQDITLDINGKIITGTKDIYTINNSGEFTIIDNATTPGSVVNKDGVALKNETSGILTLGELEEELDVSTTKPYINGGTFGIVNEYIDANTKGKFNFYDGMISGNIAIEGEVNDKPYLYNASVVTSDDRQTATLKILEDAEAKIVRTGVYYTKVEQAVSDTNKGTSEEKVTNTLLMQGFKSVGEYGFNYDSETNTLTSTNNHNSKSYTTIDLTGYETDEQLTFNGFKTRNDSTASITIKEDNKNGTLVTPSENADISLDASTITYILSKGKRYYVELGYTVTSLTEEDKFVINSINLQPIKKYEVTKNTEFKSLSTTYGFDYDEETRTFKSNNQYISGSTAFSYIEVDLTNSTENKQVIINASLDTLSPSNVGNIVVSEDNNKLTSSTRSALAYMYVSGYSSDKNYSGTFVGPEQHTRVLQKGKKYYIQFYYFKSSDDSYTIDDYKNNDSNDQFIINSIDVVSASSALKDYDLQNDLIRDEGINFYSSSNYIYTYDAGHAYLKADLTNETEDKVLRLKLYSSYQNFYVVVSDSTDIPENKNAIIDTSNKTIYDNEYNYGTIPHGKISYIHFVKKGTNYLTLNEVSILNEKNIDLNTELITNNKGFTNYNSQENSYTTPLNIGAKEKYDSYLKIDLTNYKEDQMISINAHLATTSYNLSNIYITSNPKDVSAENLYTNPSNTLLTYNSSKSPGNNDAYYFTTYSYILPKGNVYYVHFSDYNYSLNSSTIYSSNLFQIKSVKLSPLTGSIFSTGKNPYMKGTIAQGDSANDFVTEDETNDKSFRFIGSNAKNYVKFNNEIWRVIGIFSTTNEKGVKANRIKLVRNDSISDNLAWDTSLHTINNGLGINDWSQADVMKLLNNGYEDNEDELETGETIKVNNSLYYDKKSGKCFAQGGYNKTTDCDFSSTGLNDEAKKMIESVVWNTGAMPFDTSKLTPLDVYTYERGNFNGKQDFDSSKASFTVDNYQRKTTWTGKVGLPYASDIIMASGDGNDNNRNVCMASTLNTYGDCLYNNNWMKNMGSSLIVTMNVNYGAQYPSFITLMTPSITSYPAGSSYGGSASFRPAVYLNTKVKVESGTGTSADPFILTLGNEDNNTLYYGLVPKLLEKEDDTTINDKEPTNDYTLLKNGDVYGFTYNSESNTFTNENKSLNSSTAISYIKIDLTNEKSDKTIKINYLSTSNYYMASTVVHINLMKDSLRKIDYTISDENSPNSYYKDSIYRKSITEYSNNQPGTIIQKLEKGNIYYLQFAVVKNTSDRYTEEFNFNIEYMDDEDKKENYTRYDGIIPTLNKEADTVQVLKDIILSQSLNIENTRSMILDLNGHTITTISNDYVINNSGDLTITDSKYSSDVIENINTSSTSDDTTTGTIKSTSNSVIYNNVDSSLNIREGNIVLKKRGNFNAITNLGNLILGTNSNIDSDGIAIYNDVNSQATINSESINANQYAVYNNTDRKLTLNVGNVISKDYFVYNSGGSELDITAKSINSANGIYNSGLENASININTSTNTNDFLYNVGLGNINISAKTISGSIQNNGKSDIEAKITFRAYKITNNDTGTININSSNATISEGIYNNGSGNIIVNAKTINEGIHNNGSGNVTGIIGKIESKNIGIENNDSGLVDATIDTLTMNYSSTGTSSKIYGIKNGGVGTINLTIPNVSINSKGGYAIYNQSKGNIYFNGNNISLSEKGSIGIYNKSEGLIEVNNTKILASTDSNKESKAAIYSESSGTINFYNGSIQYWFEYGILNESNGTVDLGDKVDINAYGNGIKNETGIIKIKKGDISSISPVVENNLGTVSIVNSVFKTSSGNSSNIIKNSSGTITIDDSSILGDIENIKERSYTTINDSTIDGNILNGGTFNINSGTYNFSGDGANNTGVMTIKDGILNGSVNSSGTLNIFGGTITSEETAINVSSSKSTTNIIGGKIIGTYGAIRGSNDSVINIGEKDGKINKNSVIISGGTYGIYDDSYGSNPEYARFNFYDGVITGKANSVIDAVISDSEDGYDLYSTTNSENSDLVDVTLEIPSKEKFGDVAEVDGISYPSIKAAFNSIDSTENKVIKLLKDSLTISNIGESNKNITIDTHGKTIKYCGEETYIENNNNLKIIDEEKNADGKINSVYSTIVDNSGYLNITGKNNSYLVSKNSTLINGKSGIIDINAGIDSAWNNINNISTGTVNINSGEITSTYNYSKTIENENGIININDSTIKGSQVGIENNTGQINILSSNSSIISDGTGIYNNSGTVNIKNGAIKGSSKGIYNGNSGNLIFDAGDISSKYYGIENHGNFQMNNGNISASSVGVYLADNSISTIAGGKISYFSYGLYGNKVALFGINVLDKSVANVSSVSIEGFKKGISVEGTLNYGIKGDTDSDGNLNVSKENPIINASDIGIDVTSKGIFNFYDGKVIGNTAISGIVNEIEDGYQIISEQNESKEIKYLDKKMIVKNLSTEKEYSDLQDAINNASNKDTLQLINSVIIMLSDTINIPSDKDIVLDINDKKIDINNSAVINNLGTLKITDSTNTKDSDNNIVYGNGKIQTLNKQLFENSGMLTLDTVVLESGDNNTGNFITNNKNAQLLLKNTKVTTTSSGAIYNNSDNELKIENSDIKVNGDFIIYNNAPADLKVNNSNITISSENSNQNFINNVSSGLLTISDSKISMDTDKNNILIYNESGNEVNITNSELYSDGNEILYNKNGDVIKIQNSLVCNGKKLYSKNSIISCEVSGAQRSLYNENGKNISITNSILGRLENESDSGIVNIISGNIASITNLGTLNIGTKNNDESVEIVVGSVGNYNEGTFNLYEGTIKKSFDREDGLTTLVDNTGIFNMYGGIINSHRSDDTSSHIYALNSYGQFNMYGGEIVVTNGNENDISVSVSGVTNLYDGTITNTNGIGMKVNNSVVTGKKCTINAKIGVKSSGTSSIKNCTINANTKGIIVDEDDTSNADTTGIVASILTLTDNEITATDGYGIDNSGTLIIESGSVTSINSIGVYNRNGKISIGIKGDKDSQDNNLTSITDPMIKGKYYGVSAKYASSSGISFYDGIIKGENDIDLLFNEIELNYDVFKTTDKDNNKVCYLKSEKLLKNLSTNKEYYELQDAVNDASNGDTLQFIRSKNYNQYNMSSTIINSDKNIILDINGNIIETSNYYEYITNYGVLKIIDSKNSFDENGIITSGTGKIYHDKNKSLSGGDMLGAALIVNYGTLDISGGLLESSNTGNVIGLKSGSITLNSGGITGETLFSKRDTNFNMNGGQVDIKTLLLSTCTIKSGTFNSQEIAGITINMYGGIINSSKVRGNSINVFGGTVNGTITEFETLNIGTKDENVSTEIPSITSVISEYGENKVGIFNFYDGKIRSISGRINEVQPGYRVVSNNDYNILTPIGDDERVAMVNGINFANLQAAINSVKDNIESNIVIYKDIELTEDIIVPENKIINLYLNGHTIIYGDYKFVKNGTLTIIDSASSESIGASIINTIGKILNINQNRKNIIVYEMSDGSKLSTENTYNLYKKVDNEYKLLNMEKDEEVGRYITGLNNSEMTSIKGRIYLNNLEEGSYKLVSSDNKDIEFTIVEDGKVNGNVLENPSESKKVIETALAYLIITIQTGVNQIKYIIYIVLIVSIILGLCLAFKEQRKLSRKM